MILLTFDTSAESEAALGVAADLANKFGETLHVLLVVDGPLRAAFADIARSRDSNVDQVAQQSLDDIVSRAAELADTATGSFRHAIEAGPAIVEAAADEDVALVVMATHGRSGLNRLLAGSVTDYVIRNSDVPVVAVPVRQR